MVWTAVLVGRRHPVIGVSPAVPGDRFRFTLAHEIGHLTIHVRKTTNTEHEANRFASALLVPLAEFEAAMPERPSLKDFTTMKQHWGSSVAALVYRAHETGVIDDQRFRALQIQMSKWRRNEPGEFPSSKGNLLPQLVEANGGVATVAPQLGVNTSHLAWLVSWTHLRATGSSLTDCATIAAAIELRSRGLLERLAMHATVPVTIAASTPLRFQTDPLPTTPRLHQMDYHPHLQNQRPPPSVRRVEPGI